MWKQTLAKVVGQIALSGTIGVVTALSAGAALNMTGHQFSLPIFSDAPSTNVQASPTVLPPILGPATPTVAATATQPPATPPPAPAATQPPATPPPAPVATQPPATPPPAPVATQPPATPPPAPTQGTGNGGKEGSGGGDNGGKDGSGGGDSGGHEGSGGGDSGGSGGDSGSGGD